MLPKKEASVLSLLLFKRGMRPGAYVEELERICGDELDEILRGLNERLEEVGLEIVVIDESDEILGESKRRAFIRSKDALKRQSLKMCGWDRRFLAALAVTSAYLATRGGRAKRAEIVDVLKSKGISARKIERMIEAGYLSSRDDVLSLSWRAKAEIDQEKLKSLFLSAPAKSNAEKG